MGGRFVLGVLAAALIAFFSMPVALLVLMALRGVA
jgi:hypothetical protein